MEIELSLLKQRVDFVEKDAERREKMQDARHAEAMSKFQQQDARHGELLAALREVSTTVASARDFNRGLKASAAIIWAAVGSVPGAVVMWIIKGGHAP